MAQVYDFNDERYKRAITQDHIDVADSIFDDLPEDWDWDDAPQPIRVRVELPDQPAYTWGGVFMQFLTGLCLGLVIITCVVGLMG